jgi:DHA3 family macrolide efflux protein-like MFS transporter
MHGRVFTLANSVAAAMSPLGLIIAGPVADVLGVRAWFVLGGVACLLMAIISFMIPAVMHLENTRGDSVETQPGPQNIGQIKAGDVA